MATIAQGLPTKEFFLNMLTRDIELNDAILDLLDNCLDGVVRSKGIDQKKTDPKYYEGYAADINISENKFSITDNCGGIPRDIAENNAFRMGRTSTTGTGLPTVGIYGIGMKRAIFKIGKTAQVITKNKEMAYCVKIENKWANDPVNWGFPIEELPADSLETNGTKIEVIELNPGISNQWNTKDKLDNFVDLLTDAIKSSYSLIIEKGFKIRINGKPIDALPVQLLISNGKSGIKPYIYQKEYGDVSVKLTVGFYAPPPSDDDLDDGNESKRTSAEAGWTVVCNDRVVLYNDKSHLTGWGEAGVPQYHTQFIGIKGIVVFESNNPENLPMTTTKRGVDLSSSIYADVKNKMRDGLKMFIDYTNKWKGRIREERNFSNVAVRVPYTKILEDNKEFQDSYGINLRSYGGGHIFKPNLPKPKVDKRYVIIRFSKPWEDVSFLSNYFNNDTSIKVEPSIVGEMCFNKILEIAHKVGSEDGNE